MPSVKVAKSGVHPNVDALLKLPDGELFAKLDFKIIGLDSSRAVLRHLLDDYLDAWPRELAMVSLAHALLPPLIRPLGIEILPILFDEGLPGIGKSARQKVLQHFYGKFNKILNLDTTLRALTYHAHVFRDCLLCVDDYKGMHDRQTVNVETLIQYGYDGSMRAALNKVGTLRDAKAVRSLLSLSGQLFPSTETSAISRALLLNAKRHDHMATSSRFENCLANQEFYSGVTPYYIHHFLQHDAKRVREQFLEKQQETCKNGFLGIGAGSRVAGNLALNATAWEFLLNLMLDQGVIGDERFRALLDEHASHLRLLGQEIRARLQAEGTAQVFVNVIAQLIQSGEFGIADALPSFERHPIWIGVRPMEEPEVVLVYPEVALNAVIRKLDTFRTNVASLGRQLKDEGFLLRPEEGRATRRITLCGQQHKGWPIIAAKLGLGPSLISYRPPDPAADPRDENGMI